MFPAYGVDPLPTDHKAAGLGWANLAGVPGGIPHRTTIYQTIPAGASYTTIQNAINSCPSNQVVQLSAGSYNLGGNRINILNNYVTLRGAGAGATILTNTDRPSVSIGDWQWWNDETANPTDGTHVNWTSGYAQGATSITVASTTGYQVGMIIVLDQLNDSDTDAGGNSSNGLYAQYEYTSIAHPNYGYDRYQYQVNRIVAINGTTITLSEPLYMPNWSASLSPQVWRFVHQPVVMSGVEDMEMADGVQIHNGYGCWMYNITAHNGNVTADGVLRIYWSNRCTIDHCYYDANTSGLDTYGIESRACAGLLVQNNISNRIGTPLMPNGCSGSVWAYNVMTNIVPFYAVILHGLLQHGGNPTMNLYEGNYCPSIGFDNTWGCSAYNAALRNRATGYDVGGQSGQKNAFSVNIMNRHCSSIGNVLGTANVNTWYEDYGGQSGGCHSDNGVYYIGFHDVGCQEPHDTLSRSTLTRAYNWTSATLTNNGIVNDGYSSSDIPASYYLGAKPSWFGSLPWPAVDPASPAYSSSLTNIPAGYRLVFGVDPPTSALTAPVNLNFTTP